MKRMLITGFEPFGGEQMNPSWEAVSLLPNSVGDYQLTKICVPVEFENAVNMVMETAKTVCPDVILCIGQAGGRCAITPELVGINLRHAEMPDNRGYQPKDEQIIPNGATAFFSTLPVRNIATAIQNAGIKSQVSYSAGAYVCNEVLYALLANFQDSDTKVGFIHIPYCPEQNKTPAMELSDAVKGLKIAIEVISQE